MQLVMGLKLGLCSDHSNTGQLGLYKSHFVYRGIIMLVQVWAFQLAFQLYAILRHPRQLWLQLGEDPQMGLKVRSPHTFVHLACRYWKCARIWEASQETFTRATQDPYFCILFSLVFFFLPAFNFAHKSVVTL